jgi:hypothetical protein
MNYKNFFLIFLIIIINGCVTNPVNKKSTDINIYKKSFTNKGFALVYNDDLFKKKIISKKLDNRSLIIFQKNLKKGTSVKVTNLLNNKSTVATIGKRSIYPNFNNSVLSKRVADEIELNLNNSYVEIYEILENSSFIIKKAKTFDEEKNVANKAPVETISINDLNNKAKISKKVKKVKFNYIIKVADFYYKDSANLLLKRIKEELSINNIRLTSITNTKYRVFLGPFYNINSLQNSFNDISILDFENIEIIKNVKIK